METTTYAENPNSIEAFAELIRNGLPQLIDDGTEGAVYQQSDQDLTCWKGREEAFLIHLSNGATFQFTLVQRDEADELADEDEC